MKNSLLFSGLLLCTVAFAQTPDSTQSTTTTTAADANALTTAYVADAQSLKGLTSETLRPEHAFPVLGSYTASGTSTGSVTVTLDPVNKGIVWVEGLPQGRFKALMKKAPSTYKIPAQKTEDGKDIAEGTLFLNPASKELSIVLGRAYNEAEPTASITAATNVKQKTKAWQYTGLKAAAAPATQP